MGHLQVQLNNQICYGGVPQPVYVRPNSFRTNEVQLGQYYLAYRSGITLPLGQYYLAYRSGITLPLGQYYLAYRSGITLPLGQYHLAYR